MRLKGGSSLREGRVEMVWHDEWVALSHHYWNQNSADIICKQLGYINGAEEVVTTDRYVRIHTYIHMSVYSTNAIT